MADPVKIQTKLGSNTSADPQATTFDNPVTPGSVVVACIYEGSAGGSGTVVDNKGGNTWHILTNNKDLLVDNDGVFMAWTYVVNGGSGFTVTVDFTTGCRVDLIEVGPCDPSPLSQNTSAYNASSASPASGSVTTNASVKEVAVGYLGTVTAPPAVTAGGGFTKDFEGDFRALFYLDAIAPSTSVNCQGTFGGSQEWAMLLATFKGLAVAAPPVGHVYPGPVVPSLQQRM